LETLKKKIDRHLQQFLNVRSKGIQGSNTDFLICAAAVRRDMAIFTIDKDFLRFAKCLPIVLHESGA
jgi:predicted nucleic acid-binding protein